MKKLKELNVSDIIETIQNSNSIGQVLRKLDVSDGTSNRRYIESLIKDNNLQLKIKLSKKEEYELNPKYCKHCGKKLEWCQDIKRKDFCNQSCAASYNNKSRKLNKIQKSLIQETCPQCGKYKNIRATLCKSCYDLKVTTSNKTLGYYLDKYKYSTTACSQIRKNAQAVMINNNIIRECKYCHNPEVEPILEVHHLKGIMEFSKDTLVSDINSIENLVYLCPNHHALLHKGLIIL